MKAPIKRTIRNKKINEMNNQIPDEPSCPPFLFEDIVSP
jgi:hypothetical protein